MYNLEEFKKELIPLLVFNKPLKEFHYSFMSWFLHYKMYMKTFNSFEEWTNDFFHHCNLEQHSVQLKTN